MCTLPAPQRKHGQWIIRNGVDLLTSTHKKPLFCCFGVFFWNGVRPSNTCPWRKDIRFSCFFFHNLGLFNKHNKELECLCTTDVFPYPDMGSPNWTIHSLTQTVLWWLALDICVCTTRLLGKLAHYTGTAKSFNEVYCFRNSLPKQQNQLK